MESILSRSVDVNPMPFTRDQLYVLPEPCVDCLTPVAWGNRGVEILRVRYLRKQLQRCATTGVGAGCTERRRLGDSSC